jgi:hypothetical protein
MMNRTLLLIAALALHVGSFTGAFAADTPITKPAGAPQKIMGPKLPLGMRSDLSTEGGVQIFWSVETWQPGQVGFRLERREIENGKEGAWQGIGPAVMRPNFDNAWLEKNKLARVIAQKPQFKANIDLDNLASLFQTSADEFQKIRLIGHMDIQWAVALGLGWVDGGAVKLKTYEYRAAPVFVESGNERVGAYLAPVRVTVDLPALTAPALTSFQVKRRTQSGLTQVNWELPVADMKANPKIVSFVVYAGPLDEPESKVAGEVSIMLARAGSAPDRAAFEFLELNASKDRCKYAIAFKDSLGRVGSLAQRVIVKAEGPELLPVKGLNVKLEKEGAVLTWSNQNPLEANIEGLEVNRMVAGGDSKWVVLNEKLLPWGQSYYRDETVSSLAPGAKVEYQVRVVSGSARNSQISDRARLELPELPLAPLVNFKVTSAIRDGVGYLDFSWDKPQTPVKWLEIRALNPNTGQWNELTGFPGDKQSGSFESKKGSYFTEGTVQLRPYAVSQEKLTPLADPVTVSLPPSHPPGEVKAFTAKEEEFATRFTWTAQATPWVKGYRILADGKPVADESKLETYGRSWVLWGVPVAGRKYTIVAVDSMGQTSSPASAGK